MQSIQNLLEDVLTAANMARKGQKRLKRSLKEDGTILTRVDSDIDHFLSERIALKYPDANIITEESAHDYDPVKEYTFAVDPIDGTDVFSQGMPGWAISIGLLDSKSNPIAGIAFAPQWGSGSGSLFFADINKKLICNKKRLPPLCEVGELSGNSQVMIGSTLHKTFDLSRFPGKLRNSGSTVINIFAPLIHSAVIGALLNPPHIWDILGAHAIVKSHGLNIELFQGGEVGYQYMLEGQKAKDFLICGTRAAIKLIQASFSPL